MLLLGVWLLFWKLVPEPWPWWQIVQPNLPAGCGLESPTNKSIRGCEQYGCGTPRRTVIVTGNGPVSRFHSGLLSKNDSAALRVVTVEVFAASSVVPIRVMTSPMLSPAFAASELG